MASEAQEQHCLNLIDRLSALEAPTIEDLLALASAHAQVLLLSGDPADAQWRVTAAQDALRRTLKQDASNLDARAALAAYETRPTAVAMLTEVLSEDPSHPDALALMEIELRFSGGADATQIIEVLRAAYDAQEPGTRSRTTAQELYKAYIRERSETPALKFRRIALNELGIGDLENAEHTAACQYSALLLDTAALCLDALEREFEQAPASDRERASWSTSALTLYPFLGSNDTMKDQQPFRRYKSLIARGAGWVNPPADFLLTQSLLTLSPARKTALLMQATKRQGYPAGKAAYWLALHLLEIGDPGAVDVLERIQSEGDRTYASLAAIRLGAPH